MLSLTDISREYQKVIQLPKSVSLQHSVLKIVQKSSAKGTRLLPMLAGSKARHASYRERQETLLGPATKMTVTGTPDTDADWRLNHRGNKKEARLWLGQARRRRRSTVTRKRLPRAGHWLGSLQ